MDALMWVYWVSLATMHMLAWYLLLVVLARMFIALLHVPSLIRLFSRDCHSVTNSLVTSIDSRLRHVKGDEERRVLAWTYFLIIVVAANVVTGTLFRALPSYEPREHRKPAVAAVNHLPAHPSTTLAPRSMPAAPP